MSIVLTNINSSTTRMWRIKESKVDIFTCIVLQCFIQVKENTTKTINTITGMRKEVFMDGKAIF